MSSREEMAPNQPENTKRYTIDELLALMEPQYRADQDTIRRCIAGLTEHAAQLAAKGREEQLPRLRALCIEMAEFWGLAEDDTWEGFWKMEEQIGGDFDSAVSAAQDSGHAPEMRWMSLGRGVIAPEKRHPLGGRQGQAAVAHQPAGSQSI